MDRRYLYIAFIAYIAIFASCSSSRQKLDDFLKENMHELHIAGMQAAYLRDGKLAWKGSYGFANYETHEMVSDSTLFMIASCSKPVTALGLMKLVEEQKLSLDEDINIHLPFKIRNPQYPDSVITPRMLLTHTSSLTDNWDVLLPLYTHEKGGDSPISLAEFISSYFISDGKFYSLNNFAENPPRTERMYSNTGYALAGYLIEQISGQPFADFMKTEIFEPLQMHDSFWFLADAADHRIAHPHEFTGSEDTLSYNVLKHYGYPTYPDGQLRTTVSDYAKLIALFLNNGKAAGRQFLQQSTIKQFLEIQYPDVAPYQAIAWNYNEFDQWLYYLLLPRLPSHTGVDPGVATVVSFNPENDTAAIIFANTLTHGLWDHKKFYLDMVKRLLNEAGNDS